MAVIVEHISKAFSGRQVLSDVNGRAEYGEITGIVGPSGRGKTTLFKILMGFLPADSGQVSGLEGKRLSAVFQEDRLIEWLDILGNLRFVRDQPPDAQLLFGLGLNEYLTKPVHQLSGGTRRRVALARALHAEYDILLLDEPFTGLDDRTKEKVMDTLRDFTAGKTVMMACHDWTAIKYLGIRQLWNLEE